MDTPWLTRKSLKDYTGYGWDFWKGRAGKFFSEYSHGRAFWYAKDDVDNFIKSNKL